MLGRKNTPKRPVRQRLRRSDPSGHKAFSYYERRSDDGLNTGRQVQRDEEQKTRRPRNKSWRQRIGLLLLAAVMLVATIKILSLDTAVTVMRLPGDQNQFLLRSNDVYEAAASKSLAASFLNRNKITINSNKLTGDLQHQFPELASTSVTLPLLAHRPIIYIQAAQPSLILAARSGSYVLDNTGKTLFLTDNLPANTSLTVPVVTDQSNLDPKINHQALPANAVVAIQTIAAQLAHRGVKIAAMTLPPGASEVDANIAGQPYFVKFNLQTDNARQQAGTFLALQSQLKNQSLTPLHYIDVRLAGRAYYQ